MFLLARLGSNMLPSTSSFTGLRCCDTSVTALTQTSRLRRPLARHVMQLFFTQHMRGACHGSGATYPAFAVEKLVELTETPHALRVVNILLIQKGWASH